MACGTTVASNAFLDRFGPECLYTLPCTVPALCALLHAYRLGVATLRRHCIHLDVARKACMTMRSRQLRSFHGRLATAYRRCCAVQCTAVMASEHGQTAALLHITSHLKHHMRHNPYPKDDLRADCGVFCLSAEIRCNRILRSKVMCCSTCFRLQGLVVASIQP